MILDFRFMNSKTLNFYDFGFENYLMLTFIGASFFNDITPLVTRVSPAFNPESIRTEESVLVVVSTITSLAFPIFEIYTFFPLLTGTIASDGTTIASLIMASGNFTSAKVPGKSFPSVLSAMARIFKVRVATSISGSIAYIFPV